MTYSSLGKSRYLWFTDTHLNNVLPWRKAFFIRNLIKEKPKGIFISGDIANGIFTPFNLKLLAKFVKCPIYFVLGNHDYYFSSIDNTHQKIRDLCQEHSNLIWLTDSDIVGLTDKVALIGTEGWYDAAIGDPNYLKYTLDWRLIDDFKKTQSMSDRIEIFRALADRSSSIISEKLNKAIEMGYKSIYILTHFPPWKEATRDEGTMMESFWLPYNVNLRLGKTIENIMANHKKRSVIVLSGHTHCETSILVKNNIYCTVGAANYLGGAIKNQHILFI